MEMTWGWAFVANTFTAVASYGIGFIPLLITSPSRLATLATFARGRLIGIGLVALIERIAMIEHAGAISPKELGFTRTLAAICVLAGFLFTFIADRRSRRAEPDARQLPPTAYFPQDGVELRQPQQMEGSGSHSQRQQRIFLFTFALVLCGFMRNVDITSDLNPATGPDEPDPHPVPVFLLTTSENALTALAFTTILRSASLPANRCERHLLVLTMAPLLSLLLSYVCISIFKIRVAESQPFAVFGLNSFTGGMFAFVAFVLAKPLANSSGVQRRRGSCTNFLLLAFGATSTFIIAIPLVSLSNWLLSRKP